MMGARLIEGRREVGRLAGRSVRLCSLRTDCTDLLELQFVRAEELGR